MFLPFRFNMMVCVFDWCAVVLLKYKLYDNDNMTLMFYDHDEIILVMVVDVGMYGQKGTNVYVF